MPFVRTATRRYFYFSSLQGDGLKHAVFTRHGGISQAPWDSLNLGGSVGDDPNHVLENKQRAMKMLELDSNSVFDVWQVHGTTVLTADVPRKNSFPQIQADAIITDKPGISLLMRFADCVPILLYDPKHLAVGIVHAGWKGTVKGVARNAVRSMQESFRSKPEEILAGIGPSIGPDHYEIGTNVIEEVKKSFGHQADVLLRSMDARIYFNLSNKQ